MSGVALPIDLTLAGVVPAAEPVPADPRLPAQTGPSSVRELAQAAVTLPDTVTAEDARRAFGDHPHAGGVVLLGPHQVPTCYLDRNRFMLAISGPYGRALYAARPAATLGEKPRILPETTVVAEALRWSLAGDPARSHHRGRLITPWYRSQRGSHGRTTMSAPCRAPARTAALHHSDG